MTDVFEALADPTRRRVLEILASGDRTAGELAAAFLVSRPAVSRHLRVLRESGLVSVRARAQERLYSLEPAALNELDDWLAPLRVFWERRLDALAEHLEGSNREERS